MTAVVIVESPAKAKTINKYLGNKYKVLASYGHVRNLPKKKKDGTYWYSSEKKDYEYVTKRFLEAVKPKENK